MSTFTPKLSHHESRSQRQTNKSSLRLHPSLDSNILSKQLQQKQLHPVLPHHTKIRSDGPPSRSYVLNRSNLMTQVMNFDPPSFRFWIRDTTNTKSKYYYGNSGATNQLKETDARAHNTAIITRKPFGLTNDVTCMTLKNNSMNIQEMNDGKKRIMNEWPWRSLLPLSSVSIAKLNFNQSADLMESTCVDCSNNSANISSAMLNKLQTSTSPNITLGEGDSTGKTTQRTVLIVDRSSTNIQGRDRDIGRSQSIRSPEKIENFSIAGTSKRVAGELVDLPLHDVARLLPLEKTIDTNTTRNDVRSLASAQEILSVANLKPSEHLVSPTFVRGDIASTNTSSHQGSPSHTALNTLASTTATSNTISSVPVQQQEKFQKSSSCHSLLKAYAKLLWIFLLFDWVQAQSSLLSNGRVAYNGYEYITMDQCSAGTSFGSCPAPPGGNSGTCQNSYLSLPSGFELVDYSYDIVTNVVAKYPFGTHVIVFSNGQTNGVSTYSAGNPWNPNMLKTSGSTYKAGSCSLKVLMRVNFWKICSSTDGSAGEFLDLDI